MRYEILFVDEFGNRVPVRYVVMPDGTLEREPVTRPVTLAVPASADDFEKKSPLRSSIEPRAIKLRRTEMAYWTTTGLPLVPVLVRQEHTPGHFTLVGHYHLNGDVIRAGLNIQTIPTYCGGLMGTAWQERNALEMYLWDDRARGVNRTLPNFRDFVADDWCEAIPAGARLPGSPEGFTLETDLDRARWVLCASVYARLAIMAAHLRKRHLTFWDYSGGVTSNMLKWCSEFMRPYRICHEGVYHSWYVDSTAFGNPEMSPCQVKPLNKIMSIEFGSLRRAVGVHNYNSGRSVHTWSLMFNFQGEKAPIKLTNVNLTVREPPRSAYAKLNPLALRMASLGGLGGWIA